MRLAGLGGVAHCEKVGRGLLPREFGEELGEGDSELAGGEGGRAGDVFGFGAGVVLPGGLFFGIDDPAVGDSPGVELLALGQGSPYAVVRREDFDAKKNGIGWIGALQAGCSDYIRDQILSGRNSHLNFGSGFHALAPEQDLQHELDKGMK